MDFTSGLIFVGLAVAWAAYLIPKALEHHDAGARSRTIDKFSHTLRVLARREAVDRRRTRLVKSRKRPVAPEAAEAPAPEPVQELDPTQTGFFAAQTFVRRSSASRAARRRRRVLGLILVLVAMVAAAAAGRVITWWWVAVPAALLLGWLVACRLMVRGERAARRRPAQRVTGPAEQETPGVEDALEADRVVELSDDTAEVAVVRAEPPIASGDGWELVPVTLPTYVSKPAARRTVSTIDLDSTGVWTSGRTAADSALAQQADAVRSAEAEQSQRRRVSGA